MQKKILKHTILTWKEHLNNFLFKIFKMKTKLKPSGTVRGENSTLCGPPQCSPSPVFPQSILSSRWDSEKSFVTDLKGCVQIC